LLSDRFLSPTNLLNVLRQIAIVGVLAIGMTFVLITAGIDLSVGSILALVAVTAAAGVNSNGPLAGVATGLLVGTSMGLVNGLGITRGGVQPFVMTLGMLAFARGLAFVFTGGQPVPVTDPAFLAIGNGKLFGIPNPAIIFLSLLLVAHLVLRYTTFGRQVYAIGSNDEAARLSGIAVRRVRTMVYGSVPQALLMMNGGVGQIISDTWRITGVAGILYASQLGVGTPVAGESSALDAIAATVVGGTSLFGGQGGVGGTFLGAAILGVLQNTMNLNGVDPFVQRLVGGVVLVAAVMLQRKDARGG